jgi:endonuclease/exonuclease/phosphatase family metal-dependent hydrolase
MQVRFASYNIHKAVGLDRRRDPERILSILREIDADVVALQEADRRLGRRESVLPLAMISDHTHYRPVPLSMRPDSIGWHGNALLVKRGVEIISAAPVPLPVLEPRGAIRADLVIEGRALRGCISTCRASADASKCARCWRILRNWRTESQPSCSAISTSGRNAAGVSANSARSGNCFHPAPATMPGDQSRGSTA